VKNANLSKGKWLVVVGAGGGLGHFAGRWPGTIDWARADSSI